MSELAWVWGLPLSPMTRSQAVDAVMALVEAGEPSYFITANTHYAMLTHETPGLAEVNAKAAFIIADGAPLVWASRRGRTPLPERVAGSDLIFDLCERAALNGRGIFLLGGAPGVAEQAARQFVGRYPGLRIVGTESPPFRDPSAEEHEALLARIRSASPAILILAFTMPKGERWIRQNYSRLGVPVCANLGAALDFAAGHVKRAPRRLQRLGLEWAFRMALEPTRLAPRYARDAWFVLTRIVRKSARAQDAGLAASDGGRVTGVRGMDL